MRVLLTGASGKLGVYLIDRLAASPHEIIAWSGTEAGRRGGVAWAPVDLGDPESIAQALDAADPDAILHTAAVGAASAVLRDPARARSVNVSGTEALARWCRSRGRRMLYTSTDLVFDGSRPWTREEDVTCPIVAYGVTKRDAEPSVLDLPGGLVARLSLLYGPARGGRRGFFDEAMDDLRAGRPRTFFDDEYRTPLDYGTAAEALVRLLEAGTTGLVHVGGRERLSRYELMRRMSASLGIDPGLVGANRLADVPGAEPRPADVSLDTSRLATILPDLNRPGPERATRS